MSLGLPIDCTYPYGECESTGFGESLPCRIYVFTRSIVTIPIPSHEVWREAPCRSMVASRGLEGSYGISQCEGLIWHRSCIVDSHQPRSALERKGLEEKRPRPEPWVAGSRPDPFDFGRRILGDSSQREFSRRGFPEPRGFNTYPPHPPRGRVGDSLPRKTPTPSPRCGGFYARGSIACAKVTRQLWETSLSRVFSRLYSPSRAGLIPARRESSQH